MMIPVSTIFLAFFVFDILGDEIGGLKAIWVPILMCSLVLLSMLVLCIIDKKFNKRLGGKVYAISSDEEIVPL